ncbi:MAG: 6-phosphogluconolactonase [Thermoplasmata archaeon]
MVLRVGRRVRVFGDLERASAALARELAHDAAAAVRAHGRFRWVISGGRTPLPLYAMLADAHRSGFPWAETEVFFADERCVPPDDPQSNFGAAWGTFLSRVPIPRRRIHRMLGELRPRSEAADRYARLLGPLPHPGGDAPLFDAVLLGIGPDGHTASLFPGHSAVRERKRAVVATAPGSLPPPVPRLTLTLPALSSARKVVFLVAGSDKVSAISQILRSGAKGNPRWPASLVRPAGTTEWFLDRAAAAGVPAAGRTSR